MRKSGGGAQVVRKSSAVAVGAPRSPLPSTKPGSAKPRWSGSLEELAARKRQRRQVLRSDDVPAAPPATSDVTPQSLPNESAAASARSTLLASRRHWKGQRHRDVPCWLASLLLHMFAVVTLGSLTIPVGRQTTVMTMLLSFGDFSTPADDSQLEVLPELRLAAVETHATPLGADSPTTGPKADEIFAPAQLEKVPDRVAKPSDRSLVPQQTESLNQVAGTQPNPELPGSSDVAGDGEESLPSDEKERLQDIVVDKFIEFDVGRLTGVEGAKARHDFDRLGPNAIRALVRGLNKSASIHASCPVMVIASKIETVLNENPDPALLRYALDNIGRDVPENAPHLGRLQGLLSSLNHLRPSRSRTLAKLLASLKVQERRPAMTSLKKLTADADTFADFERQELAWEAIRLLNHRAPEVRHAAHEALVAMADGTDCGPTSDTPADRVAAVRDWSLYFDEERYQAIADSVLKNAQHLAEAGKRDAARKQFQRIVRDYSGSTAADEAAAYLDSAKKFALK